MEAIYLPLAGLETGIEAAVTSMVRDRVAGLVGHVGHELRLFDVRTLLQARREDARSLGELDQFSSIHRVTLDDVRDLAPNTLVWPQEHTQSLQGIFDRHAAHDYAALGAVDEHILVLTRSEKLKLQFLLADYYCTGPKQHSLPPAGRNSQGNCSICGNSIARL